MGTGSGDGFTRVASSLLLAGLLLLLGPALAWAECESDADCGTDEVCVEIGEGCDSDDNCTIDYGCEPDPAATRAPPVDNRNICDATADCEAPFVCRDIGALHNVCLPEWVQTCESYDDCDAGDQCNTRTGLCTPEWKVDRSVGMGCDDCSEGLLCRHIGLCDAGMRHGGDPDNFTCQLRDDQFRCSLPRISCENDAECGAGESCAMDVSNPTSARVEPGRQVYCDDVVGEVDPTAPFVECVEGGTICVPDMMLEYERFLAAGRIEFEPPEPGSTSMAGGTPAPGGDSETASGSDGLDSSRGTAPSGPNDEDAPGTGAEDSSSAPLVEATGGGCSIAASGTAPVDSAPTLLLLLAGLIWARRKGWQAHVA